MISIEQTTKDVAYEFIYNYHYSKVMPVLNKYFLLVKEDWNDIWVVTLWWWTQPLWTINKLFPNCWYKTSDYLEIWKMCFVPWVNNSNYWSMILKEIIKYIKSNIKSVKFLYTLADWIMWKAWYVYQASNFMYIWNFDTLVYLDNNTWEKIHPRTAKNLCKENAEFSWKEKVFWLTYDFMEYKNISKIQWKMFRYIYPMDKKWRKLINSIYSEKENPKKENIKWYEMKKWNKIEIDMPKFNMKYEEWHNSKNIKLFKK